MTRIVGLDIGRDSAVCCVLSEFPVNIQRWFIRNRKSIIKLRCDRSGINKFLEIKPDGIVLEPTGYWYSSIWEYVAQSNNIPVFWVGHADLKYLRGSYGFTNKRDDEDSVSLAAAFFDERFIDAHGNKRFLRRFQLIEPIKRKFLEVEQLDKLRSGLTAQLKQRLSLELPEKQRFRLSISNKWQFSPFVGWCAGLIHVPAYEKMARDSVGIGLSDYSRSHAQMIVDCERRINQLEISLREDLKHPEFSPYLQAMSPFGFGLTVQTLLLCSVYPFNKFLVDDRPWIEWTESCSGKRKKIDHSLRQFQAFLGLSYSLEQSGDSKKKRFHGHGDVRSHLYMWALCKVCPQEGLRLGESEIADKIRAKYFEKMKGKQDIKGKDRITRLLFFVTRLLYSELVKQSR